MDLKYIFSKNAGNDFYIDQDLLDKIGASDKNDPDEWKSPVPVPPNKVKNLKIQKPTDYAKK